MITKALLVRELALEAVYVAISTVFLVKLHKLNKILLSLNLTGNPFELLAYEEFKPLKYFIATLLLGFIGILLILRKYRHIRYDILDFEEAMLSIIAILLIVSTIILLWVYIDNPIARAALIVFLIGGAFIASNE